MSFDFLDDNDKAPPKDAFKDLPHWVSEKNATLKAFNAINTIKLGKLDYINNNKSTRAFRTKKSYQVGTEEVAKEVGIARQSLFHNLTYGPHLSLFLGEVNRYLADKKTKRLEEKYEGVRAKPKNEVYESYKLYKRTVTELQKKNASEQVSVVISKMSLQTRHKLGL